MNLMVQTTNPKLRFLVENQLGERKTAKGLLEVPILEDVRRVGRDKVPLDLEGQKQQKIKPKGLSTHPRKSSS